MRDWGLRVWFGGVFVVEEGMVLEGRFVEGVFFSFDGVSLKEFRLFLYSWRGQVSATAGEDIGF